MRVSGILAFALFMGGGAVIAGQTPPPSTAGQTMQPGQPAPDQPTRTPARPLRPGETPPKGTAVVRGYVLAAGSGSPIRRAQVRAMSMDGHGGGVTSTDTDGRYEIKDLPGGRCSISATKSGYITSQFGQRRPGEPGTPIEIADGMAADKLSFTAGARRRDRGPHSRRHRRPDGGSAGGGHALRLHGRIMGAQGWYLKAVRFDGEDITDEGMEFAPGRHVEGLQVVFTQKVPDLSGLVIDQRGKPVLDASVVIFPANRDKWRAQSRYVRTLRPDTKGRSSWAAPGKRRRRSH